MRLIDLGEIALTESSLVMAFEKLAEYQAPRGVSKDAPMYKTMMKESFLTVSSWLFFKATEITVLDTSQAHEIPFRVDHFITDRTWFLSLGGFIAHAVEPQRRKK